MKTLIFILIMCGTLVTNALAQEFPTYEEGKAKLEILSWNLCKYENLDNLISFQVRFSNFNPDNIKDIIKNIKIKYSVNELYYVSSTLIDNKITDSPKEGIIVFKIQGNHPNILFVYDKQLELMKINNISKHEEKRNYELEEVSYHYKLYSLDVNYRDSAKSYYKNNKNTFLAITGDDKLLLNPEVKAYCLYYSGYKEEAYNILSPFNKEINNYGNICKTYSESLKNFYDLLYTELFEDKFSIAKSYYYDKDNMDSALVYFGMLKNKYLSGLKSNRTQTRDTVLYAYANSWYLSHSSSFAKDEVDSIKNILEPLTKNETNISAYYFKSLILLGNLYYSIDDINCAKENYSKVISKSNKDSEEYHTADKNLYKLYLKNPVDN